MRLSLYQKTKIDRKCLLIIHMDTTRQHTFSRAYMLSYSWPGPKSDNCSNLSSLHSWNGYPHTLLYTEIHIISTGLSL